MSSVKKVEEERDIKCNVHESDNYDLVDLEVIKTPPGNYQSAAQRRSFFDEEPEDEEPFVAFQKEPKQYRLSIDGSEPIGTNRKISVGKQTTNSPKDGFYDIFGNNPVKSTNNYLPTSIAKVGQGKMKKTLGLLLVELSYNCNFRKGAPLDGTNVLVNWAFTPVRVFGGAILKSIPPFCMSNR